MTVADDHVFDPVVVERVIRGQDAGRPMSRRERAEVVDQMHPRFTADQIAKYLGLSYETVRNILLNRAKPMTPARMSPNDYLDEGEAAAEPLPSHTFVGELVEYGDDERTWIESRTNVYECDTCFSLVRNWIGHVQVCTAARTAAKS